MDARSDSDNADTHRFSKKQNVKHFAIKSPTTSHLEKRLLQIGGTDTRSLAKKTADVYLYVEDIFLRSDAVVILYKKFKISECTRIFAIFEQYSVEKSFLIKDTEAGDKLASKLNLNTDIGFGVTTALLGMGTLSVVSGKVLKRSVGFILTSLGVFTGSKILKYESGMKIETVTELNTISNIWVVKNSGYRTTNIYNRPREDSDGKPILSNTESLSY